MGLCFRTNVAVQALLDKHCKWRWTPACRSRLGIWHENRFYFEGSMKTAWGKNLSCNPRISVHLPSGDKVVILDGTAHIIQDEEINNAEWNILDTAFQTKYHVDKGSPYICVQPEKVLAWDGEDLTTMTRWIFN